jgi:uncharacterized membrane protein YraQ (UPF0718 family)
MSSCCQTEDKQDGHSQGKKRRDWLLIGSLTVIVAALAVHASGVNVPYLSMFSHAVYSMVSVMWWGIAAGIVAVGVMQRVPREYFNAMLGRGDTLGGILRAAAAGLVLDLCSHGILMVGAKLYERGASLAQVMTFLIASPWNSISLTFILIALIGWQWTLVFIAASALIAIFTGLIYVQLIKRGILPGNPNTVDLPEGFNVFADAKQRLKHFKPGRAFFVNIVRDGFVEGRMVMRWLFFGLILAALVRTFVPTDMLTQYFGPSLMGLLLTLLVTTVIEVCSEGSTPVGAELVTRAGAPGNGFAFLMAGVATDYTEIMVLREITKSWKIALSLPLVTVPQVLALGYVMNMFGATPGG